MALKPRQGRQNLAHGVSRGSQVRPLSPTPPPPGGGGGKEGGGGRSAQGFRPRLLSCAPTGGGATYITNHWDRTLEGTQPAFLDFRNGT